MSSLEPGEVTAEPVSGAPVGATDDVPDLAHVPARITTEDMEFLERQAASHAQEPERVRVSLSVVVPVFNEARTIRQVLTDLLGLTISFDMEIIVVDDGSRDDTAAIVSTFSDSRLTFLQHAENSGKGQALLTGIQRASGTHVIPFDADSEYDARDIPRLMEPVLSGRAEVVYGARIAGMNTRYRSFWYPFGSWLTTWAANLLFSARLKDLHTCLKLVPLSILRGMNLRQAGFGLDTEVTARLLKMRQHPYEVPVSYLGRSREDGKKISWRDGFRCLAVLLHVKLRAPAALPPASPADADLPA